MPLLSGLWKLERGFLPGMQIGDVVELVPSADGNRVGIYKPGVGQIAAARVEFVHSDGTTASMRDSDFNADVDLSVVGGSGTSRPLLQLVQGIALARAGLPVREGGRCALEFDADGVTVRAYPPGPIGDPVLLSYAEVTSLHIGGRGAVTQTSGGGWIGGGFGVEGMLEGAALASVMNALTTRRKTSIETLVELSAGPKAIIVLNETETPDSLRIHMAPVFALVQAAHAAAPSQSVDRLGQLKQLGELRDAGILTEEEFRAEKARILGS